MKSRNDDSLATGGPLDSVRGFFVGLRRVRGGGSARAGASLVTTGARSILGSGFATDSLAIAAGSLATVGTAGADTGIDGLGAGVESCASQLRAPNPTPSPATSAADTQPTRLRRRRCGLADVSANASTLAISVGSGTTSVVG